MVINSFRYNPTGQLPVREKRTCAAFTAASFLEFLRNLTHPTRALSVTRLSRWPKLLSINLQVQARSDGTPFSLCILKHLTELFSHFFFLQEKHMHNAAALGGCGGGLLMRFLGQIVLTESSWAGEESRRKE